MCSHKLALTVLYTWKGRIRSCIFGSISIFKFQILSKILNGCHFLVLCGLKALGPLNIKGTYIFN